MTTVGEELPRQMARIRDEVLPSYDACGSAGALAAAMVRHELDAAARAMAEGDVGDLGNLNYKTAGAPIVIADFDAGMKRVLQLMKRGRPLVFICACRSPSRCHRTTVLARLSEALDVSVRRM